MTTEASDDLICRVRAYLAGLEPPIRADDLTDEEVAGLVMASLEFMEGYGEVHYSLPERFRLPPAPPARPPIEVTARVSEILQPYARFLEYETNSPPSRPFLRRAIQAIRNNVLLTMDEARSILREPVTPPAPPPPPR